MLGRDCHVPTGWVIHWQSRSWGSAAAEMAATRKEEKYVDLGARYIFEPIAVETLGVFNASARHLVDDLGRRISENSGEARETSFLYQRISILVQRFNVVLLHDSLPATDCTDWWSIVANFVFTFQFLNSLGTICTEGQKNLWRPSAADWGGGMSVVLCRGSTCPLSWAVDGCISRHGTTSSCQSAATSKIGKRCCSRVFSCKQHCIKYTDFYLSIFYPWEFST